MKTIKLPCLLLQPFKDHHFHPLDVEPVMKAAGMTTSREYTEIIEVCFYSRVTTESTRPGGQQKNRIQFIISNCISIKKNVPGRNSWA